MTFRISVVFACAVCAVHTAACDRKRAPEHRLEPMGRVELSEDNEHIARSIRPPPRASARDTARPAPSSRRAPTDDLSELPLVEEEYRKRKSAFSPPDDE